MASKQVLKCPKCKLPFIGKIALRHHLKNHSEYKKRSLDHKHVLVSKIKPNAQGKFHCPKCDKVFDTSHQLTGHQRKHSALLGKPAPTGPPFLCPECTKPYNKRSALGIHRRAAHGVLGKAHQPSARQLAQQSKTSIEVVHAKRSQGPEAFSPEVPTADPLAFAIAIGSVTEFCRNFAEEHAYPARQFTRQFAELFLRQARW